MLPEASFAVTVTRMASQLSPTSGSAAAAFNSTLTAVTDTTLYDFEGWFTDKDCAVGHRASTVNPYTASITSGSTYYALFKEKEITYTLSAAADNPEGYEYRNPIPPKHYHDLSEIILPTSGHSTMPLWSYPYSCLRRSLYVSARWEI